MRKLGIPSSRKFPSLLGVGILIGITVLGLSLSLAVAQGKPNGGNNKVQAPEIERGVFVDYGYSSPPWYPQDCGDPQYETDRYQWGPRIYWAGEDPLVDITVYTGGAPFSGTFDAIETGFTAWDAETGTSLYGAISEVTTSGPGVAFDDENTVQWGTIDGSGGIIGVTYYWYWRNTKEMIEFDIVLDSEESWSLTGEEDAFDVQNIATHEAGHTLVLGDLRSPKDCGLTMHAYTWFGDDLKRTLGSGDVSGVQAIYGE